MAGVDDNNNNTAVLAAMTAVQRLTAIRGKRVTIRRL